MRSTVVLFATLFLAAGCKKTSPSDICAERAVTACSFLYGCCEPLERYQLVDLDRTDPNSSDDFLSRSGAGFVVQVNDEPTESGCEEVFTAQCNASFAYLNAAAEEGRVTVDEDAVEACLKPIVDALDACEPNGFFNYDPEDNDSCDNMISGTVASGGECYEAIECADEGAVCDTTPDEMQEPNAAPTRKLKGVCKAPPQAGQDCDNGQCAGSLYCDNATMKCTAKVGLNGDCDNATCQDDLYCDQANHCVRAPGSGQPCAMGPVQCGPELTCRDMMCRPINTPTVHQYCDGT